MISNTDSIENIKEKIKPILSNYPVSKAILFGSYAKGKASKSSDIDLYIDTNGKLKGLDFVGLLEILSDALGSDIDLIDKTHVEPNSLLTREIESEGMVIYEKPENY